MTNYSADDGHTRNEAVTTSAAPTQRARRNKPPTRQVSVTLPIEVLESLNDEAATRKVSVSRVCRERIEKVHYVPMDIHAPKHNPRHFTETMSVESVRGGGEGDNHPASRSDNSVSR